MCFVTITVCREGVDRIEVFAEDASEYSEARDFHNKLAPAIERLDQHIKSIGTKQKVH